MITVIRLLILVGIYVLVSVFMGCGSAEAIKSYRYSTKKVNLQNAVTKVLKENPNIYVDMSEPKIKVRRHPENPYSDTTTKMINASDYHDVHGVDSIDFFESLKAAIKIKIKVGEIENDYVFRYQGDRYYWEKSTTSAIFISYAQDKFGNELEQGHNEKGQFNSKLAKEFTDLFEKEVINKIDRQLNLKHSIGRPNE